MRLKIIIFGFIARKELIFKYLSKYIPKDTKIIEIGAGTGNVSRYLMSKGYKNISVGELHMNGLRYASSYGIENRYQFDVFNPPFRSEFDCINLFDVIEHFDDDFQALACVRLMLKDNGYVTLTVPAHSWLWNASDADAGHKRRYSLKSLNKLLRESGFDIHVMRYFFVSITPLLFLRTLLYPDRGRVKQHDDAVLGDVGGIINSVLVFLTRLEHKIIRFIPNFFGGSIIAIATKCKVPNKENLDNS